MGQGCWSQGMKPECIVNGSLSPTACDALDLAAGGGVAGFGTGTPAPAGNFIAGTPVKRVSVMLICSKWLNDVVNHASDTTRQ